MLPCAVVITERTDGRTAAEAPKTAKALLKNARRALTIDTDSDR